MDKTLYNTKLGQSSKFFNSSTTSSTSTPSKNMSGGATATAFATLPLPLLPFRRKSLISPYIQNVRFNFHVFLIPTTFLNVCYYFLLIPFRFASRKGKSSLLSVSTNEYYIQSSILQQILSTSLIFILITYSFLDIRFILAASLEEKPEQAFHYADTLCLRFVPLFWMTTFWLKRKHFVKLLVVCQGKSLSLLETPFPDTTVTKESLPKAPLTWLINSILVSAIVKVVYILVVKGYPTPENILCEYGGQAMFALHLQEKNVRLSNEELWQDKFTFVVSILGTIVSGLLMLMEEFFDMFCVIGAIMMYAVCSHFFDKVERIANEEDENESQSFVETLKDLSRSYMDLTVMSDTINEMFSAPVVLYYLSSYPTLVWMVFALFKNNDNPVFVLYYTHKIVIFVILNVAASEACSKVQRYKRWLFEMSVSEFLTETKTHFQESNENQNPRKYLELSTSPLPPSNKKCSCTFDDPQTFLNIMHRQVNCEDVGLKGYKFFTVTYGLIGTMLGFIVTFAIVMLQFESDKKDDGCKSSMLSSSLLSASNDTFLDSDNDRIQVPL